MAGDGPSSPRPQASAERINLKIGVFGAFPGLSPSRNAPALLRQACPIHAGNADRPWSAFADRPKTERNAREPHSNANRKGKTALDYRAYQTYAMIRQRGCGQGPSLSPDPGISHRAPGNVRRTHHGRISHGATRPFGSAGRALHSASIARLAVLQRPSRGWRTPRKPVEPRAGSLSPRHGGWSGTIGDAVRPPGRFGDAPISRPGHWKRPLEAGTPGSREGQLIHSQYITRKQTPRKNGLRQ
jgi:hypothetical protein